jgi:hypothetical protein
MSDRQRAFGSLIGATTNAKQLRRRVRGGGRPPHRSALFRQVHLTGRRREALDEALLGRPRRHGAHRKEVGLQPIAWRRHRRAHASTLTVKSRLAPVRPWPRATTRASAGSVATIQLTSAQSGRSVVTLVHNMTRSDSGSPLATPWRNTALAAPDCAWARPRSGISPSQSAFVARKSRREVCRIGIG